MASYSLYYYFKSLAYMEFNVKDNQAIFLRRNITTTCVTSLWKEWYENTNLVLCSQNNDNWARQDIETNYNYEQTDALVI